VLECTYGRGALQLKSLTRRKNRARSDIRARVAPAPPSRGATDPGGDRPMVV
jgi:hypothetical protein